MNDVLHMLNKFFEYRYIYLHFEIKNKISYLTTYFTMIYKNYVFIRVNYP